MKLIYVPFSTHQSTHRRWFGCCALLFTMLLAAGVAQAQSITGKVFRDFNADGVQSTSATSTSFTEPGVGGIIVKAFSTSGIQSASATSGIDGSYTLVTTGAGPFRIEFSNLTAGDYDAFRGSSSGTSVQFAAGGSTVNYGVNYPAQYCERRDPPLVTTCFVSISNSNVIPLQNRPAMVGVPYTAVNADAEKDYATFGELGATWGLAYNKDTKQIFSSAFTKRHIGFGTGGPNAIYVTNVSSTSSGNTTPFFNFTTVGGTAVSSTTETHGNDLPSPATGSPTNTQLASYDIPAFDAVGKTSLGDIDISDDNKTMYVVNLKDRKLYKIDVATKAATGFAITNPCGGQSYRPFAVKYYRGKVYVGVVCTREDVAVPAPYGPTTGLSATVYEFDGTNFTSVLSFPLTFKKQPSNADKSVTTDAQARAEYWRPWTATYQADRNDNPVSYPQAWLTDIEFDVDGDMIVGLRDRFGDQIGYQNRKPIQGDPAFISAISPGSVMRARKCNPADATWTLESNGALCGATPSPAQDAQQGPGGGKYYWGDQVQDGGNHGSSSQAGLALLAGSGKLAMTAIDPIEAFNTGGIKRLINATGAKDGNATGTGSNPAAGKELYTSDALGYGKANGLGDLEVLCAPSPIQIGNRVWKDTNNNGVQDPGEPSLPNVTVTLKGPGLITAGVSVTTNSNGEYYFASGPGTSAIGFVYSLTGLVSGGAYTLTFPTSSSAGTLTLSSKPNSATGTNADAIDTDPDATGLVSFTLGSSGQNNFAYDAAFIDTPICAIITSVVSPTCNPATNLYTLNGTISLTSTAGGTATIIDGAQSTTITVPAAATSVAYSLTGLTSNAASHTVTVSLPGCGTATATYSAPASCSTVLSVVVATPVCNTLTNNYTATGTVSLTNAQAGSLTITDNGSTIGVISVTAGQTTASFSATGVSGSAPPSHTVIATLGTATASTTYATPASCTVCSLSITTSSLPAGQVGTAYSQTITISGATAPATFSLSAGTLPAGLSLNATTGVISGTPTSAVNSTFTVKVTDAKSCSDTQPLTIVVVCPPVNLTATSATICAGQSATLTASGANTYLWSNGASTASIVVSATTTTTYSVTGTTSAGCFAITTATLTVNPAVTATIGGNLSICAGQTTTLTASGGSTYVWSTGATTAAISVSTAGPYSVTATSAAGCSNTATVTVIQNPTPTVTAMSATICAGQTTTLTASGAVTYLWNTGATTASISVSVAGTYSVTGTSAAGCTATASATLTVNPAVTATIGGNLSICAGQTTTLTASGGSTYVWSTGATTAAISVSTAGPYSVTATSAAGCSNTATVTVVQNPTPTVTATSATICAGQSATLTASGANTYLWSNGASTASIVVSATATTTYSVTGTSAAGCTATASGTLTVNPAVTATIGGNLSICAGQTTTLTASGGSTYRWSTGATTAAISVSTAGPYSVTATSAAGCSNTATVTVVQNPAPTVTATSATICAGQSATLTASGASTYLWSNGASTASIVISATATTTYSVTGTSAAGCTATASGTLIVNGQPQINSINQGICVGNTASLTVSATNTGAGVLEYSLNGGAFQTTNVFTINAPTNTTAVIVVRTQGSSCTATESIVVNCACATPVSLTFVPTALQTCAGSPVSFTVSVSGATSASLTSSGTGTFSQQTISGATTVSYTPSLTDATAGSVTLTLTSADPDGAGSCVADQITRILTISPVPSTSATSASICAGGTAVLTASGASTYLWSNGATTQSISVSVAGTYSVTGTSAQGCTATASGTLTIYSTPTLSPASLPAGVVGVAYSQTLTGSNGTAPYTYSVTGGSLPAGLSLGLTTGVISGTPTSNAPVSFTVQVTDAKSCTAALPYSLGAVTASLGDFVFEDINANGIQEATDKPIAGVTVTLLSSGTVVATAITDVSGLYSFTGLTPGKPYSVSFTTPAGFTATTQNIGNDLFDSDGNPATGLTGVYTLTANENNTSVDMGYYKPASLGDKVFVDANKNGIQDAGETPIPGVIVTLISNGTVVATTTTLSSGTAIGCYSFTGLTPGVPYSVSFTTPANYTATIPNAPGSTTATDSDPINGITASVTLASGENNPTLDAGFYLSPAISITLTSAPVCNTATNNYMATTTVSLTSASAGTLTITDNGTTIGTISVTAGQATATVSVTGVSNATSHTVVASFNGLTASTTYAAPASCTVELKLAVTDPGTCLSATNGYTTSGVISLTNAIAGTATITDGAISTTVAVGAGATSVPYSLSGLTSGTGSHTVIVSYAGQTTSTTYTSPVSCTVCSTSLTTSMLANGQIGSAYSQTLTTSGGTAPYTYAVVGNLPTGLTLNTTTGVISGTPTAPAGTASFTVNVTDAKSCSDSQPLTITTSLAPVCSLTATATPGPCVPATNAYAVTGTVSSTNAAVNSASPQTLTISAGGQTTTATLTGNGPVSYTLTGLVSDGLVKTLTVMSSATACGMTSTTFTAPASCSTVLSVVVATPVCNTATNNYTATGTVSLTNAQAGSLTITDNGSTIAVISVTTGQTTASFSVSGVSGSSPASHMVIATLGTATASTTYATPASCECPPAKCAPFVIQQTKKGPRIVGK